MQEFLLNIIPWEKLQLDYQFRGSRIYLKKMLYMYRIQRPIPNHNGPILSEQDV